MWKERKYQSEKKKMSEKKTQEKYFIVPLHTFSQMDDEQWNPLEKANWYGLWGELKYGLWGGTSQN